MQPIQLTQDHKDKLLEMCKILFSEYELVTHDHQFNDLDFNLIGYRNLKTKNIETIHWFEFCIMDLTTKIYNISDLKKECSIKQLRGWICQYEDHPVDYLYKEFKKLKFKN